MCVLAVRLVPSGSLGPRRFHRELVAERTGDGREVQPTSISEMTTA